MEMHSPVPGPTGVTGVSADPVRPPFFAGPVNPFLRTARRSSPSRFDTSSVPPSVPPSLPTYLPTYLPPISIFSATPAPLPPPPPPAPCPRPSLTVSHFEDPSARSPSQVYLIKSIQVLALGIFSFFYAANRRLSSVL